LTFYEPNLKSRHDPTSLLSNRLATHEFFKPLLRYLVVKDAAALFGIQGKREKVLALPADCLHPCLVVGSELSLEFPAQALRQSRTLPIG
jgi:hypothetical protein